ncbi:MAG TPA: glycosyltransferase family 4 protein [Bryobacteraceae bacterium]|nr:glycosyltransferase family 4 protein [Bryobacteraceae bacterium]
MTIVHVTQYYLPDLGYQEVHLARAQVKAGHRVVVLTSDERPNLSMFPAHASSTTDERQEDGVQVVRMKARHIGNRLVLRGLTQELQSLHPDWVIAHSLMTLTTLTVCQARYQRKFTGWLTIDDHTNGSNRRPGLAADLVYAIYKKFLTPWVLGICNDFVAVTSETAGILRNQFGVPERLIRLVPLGADANLFRFDASGRAAVRARLEWRQDAVVVAYAGKLLPEKRVLELVEAMEPLAAADASIRLLIVGSGPVAYTDELNRRIRTSPHDWARLIPAVPNSELPALLSAADIGVWPGTESIVHLEAMSCGLPIIIRDLASLRDVVAGGAGLLTSGKPDDIRAKLRDLLTNADLRQSIRQRARSKVETQLCWKRLAERFEPNWKGQV